MPSFLQVLWQAFLAALFPPKCLVCRTFDGMQLPKNLVASGSMLNATAFHFCEACRKGVTPIGSPFCSKCGLPFVSRQGVDHTCLECLTEERPFRKARAFGVYDGSLMEAIHIFKYAKKASLSRPLAALVRETFLRCWDADAIDLLVPVPLHIKRLRERGFNQAYLLIKRWAEQEGLPFDGALLSRDRWTEPQTTLSRKERQRNTKGAFTARKPDRIKDKRILLVDDVYTTGATVTACAKVLLEVGAESVDILTLARAV